jgi:hypothetical protein
MLVRQGGPPRPVVAQQGTRSVSQHSGANMYIVILLRQLAGVVDLSTSASAFRSPPNLVACRMQLQAMALRGRLHISSHSRTCNETTAASGRLSQ